MHTTQQLQWQNFGQTLHSWTAPHTTPLRMSYRVSFMSCSTKNDCDISKVHCMRLFWFVCVCAFECQLCTQLALAMFWLGFIRCWGPFREWFFHHDSNSMEVSYCSHPSSCQVITMNFCVWHDSCVVMACAKFDCNCTKTNFPSNLNYDGRIIREMSPRSISSISFKITSLVQGHYTITPVSVKQP